MTPGMRGVTIRVNETSSVGGFVQPEDHVDVLLTQTEKAEANASHRPYTKTLLKNARVLATDQQTQRRQDAQPPKTVTLEVSEDDAKKLTLAGAIGQLSLTLNRGENGLDFGRVVDSRDLVGPPEKEALSDDTPVTIFRSVKREEYRVPQQ
jgi:pilus assembly protein CpaB